MQIRDPDTLLAIIAQLKAQFGHQIAELHDALAVANVRNAALGDEIARLTETVNRLTHDNELLAGAVRESGLAPTEAAMAGGVHASTRKSSYSDGAIDK